MKRISITKVKKELSSLHVNYSSFSQVYKINNYTAEICIQYSSWIKDDILAVINYLKSNYKVEERSNGTIIITPNTVLTLADSVIKGAPFRMLCEPYYISDNQNT